MPWLIGIVTDHIRIAQKNEEMKDDDYYGEEREGKIIKFIFKNYNQMTLIIMTEKERYGKIRRRSNRWTR